MPEKAINYQPQAISENYGRIWDIIQKNKKTPFVNRLINRQDYPVIGNPDGTYSTHRMSWGQVGNKYWVFPMIEMVGDELVDLRQSGIDPFEHARQNQNYIEFNTPEEADFFSKNYKKYWDLMGEEY